MSKRDKIIRLELDLACMQNARDDMIATNSRLCAKISEQMAQIEGTERAHKQLQTLHQMVVNVGNQAIEYKDLLEEKCRQLEATLAEKQVNERVDAAHIAELVQTNKALSAKVTAMAKDRDVLLADNSRLRGEVVDSRNELHAERARHKMTEGDATRLASTVVDQASRLVAQRDQLNAGHVPELRSMAARIQNQGEKLAEANRRNAILAHENAQFQARFADLARLGYQDNTGVISTLIQQTNRANWGNATVKHLRARVKGLASDNRGWEQWCAMLGAEKSNQQRIIERQHAIIQRLQQDAAGIAKARSNAEAWARHTQPSDQQAMDIFSAQQVEVCFCPVCVNKRKQERSNG